MDSSRKIQGKKEDRQWCISLIRTIGKRKPDGILNCDFIPYVVTAPDRTAALEKLRKNTKIGIYCDELDVLQSGQEVRICDFDPKLRQVTQFNPEGLARDVTHYYAAIWEKRPNDPDYLPTRQQARDNRRKAHEPLGKQFRVGLRDKWGDIGDLEPEYREKIKKGRNGCWIWTGTHDENGYGVLRDLGKNFRAHRYIFEVLRDNIPEGAILRHECNVRCCCHPGHLIPGTHLENYHDKKHRRPFVETDYVDVPAKRAKEIRLLYYAEKWTAKRIAEKFDLDPYDVRLAIKYRTGTDEKRRWYYSK